ncbi:hypothetical protein JQ557_13075 [Bradyrhizobium sp. U87765 SZCCT0131]|uniref:tetratricopeptide repeat protein n=1 Tax=unclassified Bradyrhizobium TaxID=2631580 RepID=UPI001BADC5F8|nr:MULTISPECIES: tetratricopeptide repeat protein [unclassified Bradyrhizobium]MBR1218929.1 hypothetical protein [Bradyrhizobium sp. U87765 SZCCT0131]MBR1261580.1 hypothetical protein [Bradyrhizobium sp. U87765 SZCCT0134]MBR1306567.1 hypothetical protein [Bradyrhizobium sp. U87765 SZCCT0110]MBR1317362.1 hypothetical protein [Bradyrhizobium sp. U87765 SZCCT0109]MBR1351064.1 hypothetical protein [Bradyrhizobium sp. U87765 SZCCT0048]
MSRSQYQLSLLGPFRLSAPGGERVHVSSKKGMALVAMLATARDGERTRAWLQDRLWGSRQTHEAQGSLRRELLNLRKLLNQADDVVLICERDVIRLDVERIDIDIRSPRRDSADGDFLEGLDISGEAGFEEWLREQRHDRADVIRRRLSRVRASAAPRESLSALKAPPKAPPPSAPAARNGANPGAAPADPLRSFKDRPALAVLSFENLTGDAANDYISEGISEDLIDRLSCLRWLPVIARGSSFSFAGQDDRKGISRQLDARYLLDGRLRRFGDKFMLHISLTDTTSNLTLWSQRLGLPSPCGFEHIELVVAELVAALDNRIDYAEQMRARNGRRDNLDVNDLIWRGRWHLNRFSRDDAEKARRLFAEALVLDPESSEALIQNTFYLSWTIWTGRQSASKIQEMRRLAQRAILADCNDGRGHMLAGMAEMWLRRSDTAEDMLRRAIDLNPSLALAHAELGSCMILSGRPKEAFGPLAMALRLSPNDIHIFYPLGELAIAHCMCREWSQAISFADRALMRRPGYWYAYMTKVTALYEQGDVAAAKQSFAEMMIAKPDFSRAYIEWLPFINPVWTDHFANALASVARSASSALVTQFDPA